jgi:hypothetical protein
VQRLQEKVVEEPALLTEESQQFPAPFYLEGLLYGQELANFGDSQLEFLRSLAAIGACGMLSEVLRGEVDEEDVSQLVPGGLHHNLVLDDFAAELEYARSP